MKLRHKIKQWLERKHLAKVGRNVVVHWTVGMSGIHSIFLEDHVKILMGSLIDGKVRIGKYTFIKEYAIVSASYGNGSITIGENCSVHPFCVLYGQGGLTIGNHVRIATQAVIVPMDHGYADKDIAIAQQQITAKGIVVEDDVWIGAGAKILDGSKIGMGSVIGAGAVVKGEIPPYSVAVGVPAKVIKHRG